MKSVGPFLNRDLGFRDQPRAQFSNLPIGVDMLCENQVIALDFSKTLDTAQMETVKDAGAAAAVVADADGGELVLTSTATTDNDGALVQALQTSFLCKAGRPLFFHGYMKCSAAAQNDLFIGLADTGVTDPESVVAEGLARVGFEVLDGSGLIYAVVDNDTAATKTSTGVTLADATYRRLSFRTEGGFIRFYVDDHLTNTIAIPTAIAAVTLGIAMYSLSGDASGTHTATFKRVVAAQKMV